MKTLALLISLLSCLTSVTPEAAAASEIIQVKISGHGPPVLFIPGLATPGAIWDETVKYFQARYECHVVSIAGFGSLAPVKTDHFFNDARDQIIGYVHAHKLQKPILVGHSLGGMLALAIAEQAPDLPGGIVSVDAFPFLAAFRFPGVKDEAGAKQAVAAARDTIKAQTAAQFAPNQPAGAMPKLALKPEDSRRIAKMGAASDPATVAQARIEILSADFRPALGRIKCPLVVFGALAGKLPPAPRATLEARYKTQYANAPQTRFVFFPHASHYIMIDDPAGFRAALAHALDADQATR